MSKFYPWQILILAGSTVSTGNRQSDIPFASFHAGAKVYNTAHATSQSDEASVSSCDKFARCDSTGAPRCDSTGAPYAIGSAVTSSHHARLASGQVALDTSAQESERQAARQLVSQAIALSKFESYRVLRIVCHSDSLALNSLNQQIDYVFSGCDDSQNAPTKGSLNFSRTVPTKNV